MKNIKINTENPFADMEEVKTQTVKWGRIGDWFRGTMAAKDRTIDSNYAGKVTKQRIFELMAKGGSFHRTNEDKTVAEEATVVEEGSFWTIFAEVGSSLETQLNKAKLGQDVGVRYDSDVASKTKGFAPAKIKKVFLGAMDPNYQGEMASEAHLPELN